MEMKLANQRTPTGIPADPASASLHREIVAQIAAGEVQALRVLYLEFHRLIYGITRRILENPEDAREAVQDTFIKVWKQAGAYRPDRGEVVAWLVFIARNAAIDRARQGARRRVLHQALLAETIDPVRPASDLLDQQECVTEHLALLSGSQRQALELAFFSGCSQSEIAAAMQTPIGNVKNHLRRGLMKLRQLVARHD